MNFKKLVVPFAVAAVAGIALLVAVKMLAPSKDAPSEGGLTASEFDYENFNYSQDINADGYWEGVHALDYVTLPDDFPVLAISKEDVEPTEEVIQDEIQEWLSEDTTVLEVTDRAAMLNDIVNIDYEGSVDGVVFQGGTYQGYDLYLGSGTFIDGFEEQIVGHTVGEAFDVNVTFPEGYSDSEDENGNTIPLSGKAAVFHVTINSIFVEETPELTDEWVAGFFGEIYPNATTVEALHDCIYDELSNQYKINAVLSELLEVCTVKDVPEEIVRYTYCECLNYYYTTAQYYNMTMEEFVQNYVGYETVDEMLADFEGDIREYVKQAVIYQAAAEKLGMACTDAMYEESDYAVYESDYGVNYLRMMALLNNMGQTLADNAKIA